MNNQQSKWFNGRFIRCVGMLPFERLFLLIFKALLILFTAVKSPAQPGSYSTGLSYARMVIDTLTSAAMNGRGYTDSSDRKAAVFIQHQMDQAGLLPFGSSYFQPYTLNTTVFPGAMSLVTNGHSLAPGIDYLVNAASGSCDGTFKGMRLNIPDTDTTIKAVKILSDVLSHRNNHGLFLFYAKKNFTKPQYKILQQALFETHAFGAMGVIEYSNEKLTWDASQDQLDWCYLQVKGELPASKKIRIAIDVDSEWKQNYATQNIIGYAKGTSVQDSFIVFTAHYDHLGQMGEDTFFPGANDNASGTSMVLNLAKYFSAHPTKYSMAFIYFSGEELGLLGSQYYVNHPLFPLGNIKFLVNLDIVGTGDEGIKVVNGTEFQRAFDTLVQLNEHEHLLKVVSPRGKAANSDHYLFYEKGVPCFFIYTMGGIAAYHDVFDRAETLPLTDYENLCRLLIDFVNTF